MVSRSFGCFLSVGSHRDIVLPVGYFRLLSRFAYTEEGIALSKALVSQTSTAWLLWFWVA